MQLTSKDANNQTWTTNYADANFWRPTSTQDPTGALTSLTYGTSPAVVESALNFNGTTSTWDFRMTSDTLGRTHVVQKRQAPNNTNFDSVESDYDSLGRPSRTSMPYTGTAGQTNTSGPGTATTYDALNRPLLVKDGGGGTTQYSYSQNDVVVTIGPAPSGENTKRRQLEYDGAGRLTSVCEITSASGSGSCSQNTAQTGYFTKYTYDAAGNLKTVVQNAQSSSTQTRSFTYDGLGRMLTQATPETNGAATTLVYDSDATCGTSDGDLVKRTDPVGNVTCYAYDGLHRNTSITYPSGSYASATPAGISFSIRLR